MWTFVVRKRALNDILTIGGGSEQSLANTSYGASLNGTSLSFSTSTGGVSLRKDIEASESGLTITYHLKSALASSTTISHRIENALSPSYLAVINGGRRSLEYWDGASDSSQNPTASTVGVRNSVTGNFVRFAWQNTPDQIGGAEDVFALELNPVYLCTLNPGDSVSYAFSLFANQAATGVLSPPSKLPTTYGLEQNYPNPFNPVTTIQYQLPNESHVQLSVYNVLGQEIRTLVNSTGQPGYKSVQFDASNLPSGIYFYRITYGRFTDVKKMLLLK